MTIMRLFVVRFIVSTTHGDTQKSVHKQTNNISNLTPSGDRNYQLILAALRRCFLEKYQFSFSLCFLLTTISAEQFIVPKKCPQGVHKKCPKKLATKSVHKIVPKQCPQKVSKVQGLGGEGGGGGGPIRGLGTDHVISWPMRDLTKNCIQCTINPPKSDSLPIGGGKKYTNIYRTNHASGRSAQ